MTRNLSKLGAAESSALASSPSCGERGDRDSTRSQVWLPQSQARINLVPGRDRNRFQNHSGHAALGRPFNPAQGLRALAHGQAHGGPSQDDRGHGSERENRSRAHSLGVGDRPWVILPVSCRQISDKFFRMMVARGGVEPPTPAFSAVFSQNKLVHSAAVKLRSQAKSRHFCGGITVAAEPRGFVSTLRLGSEFQEGRNKNGPSENGPRFFQTFGSFVVSRNEMLGAPEALPMQAGLLRTARQAVASSSGTSCFLRPIISALGNEQTIPTHLCCLCRASDRTCQ